MARKVSAARQKRREKEVDQGRQRLARESTADDAIAEMIERNIEEQGA